MRICMIAWIWMLSVISASGQTLVKVGEFISYEQDVGFLPGAMVVVHNSIEDSQTKLYRFRSGRFIHAIGPIPSSEKNWSSFNWFNTDRFDQIDLGFYMNASQSSYLPADSKVKALAKIDRVAPGKAIEIVCYSVDVPQQTPDAGGTVDLHLLLLSRKSGPEYTYTPYTRIQDVLVTTDGIFGAMQVEREPAGTFVVVYWEDATAAHAIHSVTIFMVKTKASHHKSKPKPS